jgi:hypothetical protein
VGKGIIQGNIVLNNSADYAGGICCELPATIVNNTIVGNVDLLNYPQDKGAGISCGEGTIRNNIVGYNSSGIFKNGIAPIAIGHNCVYGNGSYDYSGLSAGEGDISQDPKLASLEYGDMHLQSGSPCVDKGDDASAVSISSDTDGQARVSGDHVDIGADESYGEIRTVIPGIVRVSPEGDNENDGSSWTKAKKSVQAAVDALVTGGEV